MKIFGNFFKVSQCRSQDEDLNTINKKQTSPQQATRNSLI